MVYDIKEPEEKKPEVKEKQPKAENLLKPVPTPYNNPQHDLEFDD